MKLVFIFLSAIMLAGCGKHGKQYQADAAFAGASEICYQGVSYIQFTSGTSVKYLPDGKISTCVK